MTFIGQSNDFTDTASAAASLLQRFRAGAAGTTLVMQLGKGGLLELPLALSGTTGIRLGADVDLYRSAADVMRTPDSLTVDGNLTVSGVTGIGAAPVNDFNVSFSRAASTTIMIVDNTSAAANSHCAVYSRVAAAAAGDPLFLSSIVGGSTWSWGADNSDSDSWKLNPSTAVGSGDAITVTTALAVTLAGTLTVSGTGNSTISGPLLISGASAGQVVFPAAQNASAGANTLDDYEEGTFTPTLIGSTTAGTQTYVVQVGSYTKVGRLVIANLYVEISAKDAAMAGNVRIGGLPFAASNVSNLFTSSAIGQHSGWNLTAGFGWITGTVPHNTATYIDVFEAGDNVTTTAIAVGAIAASTWIMATVAYHT